MASEPAPPDGSRQGWAACNELVEPDAHVPHLSRGGFALPAFRDEVEVHAQHLAQIYGEGTLIRAKVRGGNGY